MTCPEVFSSNSDIYKTAFLNWRMSEEDIPENLFQMGKAFGEGAMVLLDNCLKDNYGHRADMLIFPILYGVDQCIEVIIKAIICSIEPLKGTVKKLKGHDISCLLSFVMEKIKAHSGSDSGLEDHLRPVQRYVDELFRYIGSSSKKADMSFARYPIDTKGNPFFYVISHDNVTVNLAILRERLKSIMDSLEALYFQYSVEQT